MSEPVVPGWSAGTILVSIEGIDGAGKSTLLEGLVADESLRHEFPQIHAVREFDSPLGECLRANLDALSPISILYAFASERHWLLERCAALSAGLVLWDRYTDSVFACRSADVEAGRMPRHLMSVVQETTARMPPPTLILFVDTPVSVAFDRTVRRQARLGLPVRNDIETLDLQRAAYLRRLKTAARASVLLDGTVSPVDLVLQARDALLQWLAGGGPAAGVTAER